MGRARLRVTLGVALAMLLTGCGAGDSDESRAVKTTTVTTTAEAAPAGEPDELDVQRFVRDHYVSLNRGKLEEAFSHFSPGLRAELGPIETFKSGYRYTEGTEVKSIDVIERSEQEAVVAIELYADAIDACSEHIAQTFAGTWNVDLSGATPVFADAEIAWTGGPEATEDPSECADTASASRRPAWMRGLGGGVPATADAASFCERHDCIPNFPNGRGYRVQCADGTWSQSGGIQGACSYHGGVG